MSPFGSAQQLFPDRSRHAQIRMTPRAFIFILWLSGAVAVICGGMLTDGYQTVALQLLEPQFYPIGGVAKMLAVVCIESAAIWAIIRPQSYVRSWLRSFFAFVFTGASGCFFGLSLMHAPPYQTLHFFWLALVSVFLLVTGFASAVAAARHHEQTKTVS